MKGNEFLRSAKERLSVFWAQPSLGCLVVLAHSRFGQKAESLILSTRTVLRELIGLVASPPVPADGQGLNLPMVHGH